MSWDSAIYEQSRAVCYLFPFGDIIIFIVPICCLTETNDRELLSVASRLKMGEVAIESLGEKVDPDKTIVVERLEDGGPV